MANKFSKIQTKWDVVECNSIGECVTSLFESVEVGKILGVTSKGVFVKFYSEKLIFLSLEKYSGPMTVNCINLKNIKNNFIEGQPVFWGNRILYLPSSRIIIPLDPSNIRRISLPVSTQKNIEFQHDRLQFYISLALQEKLLQSNYDQQQHSIKLIRLIKIGRAHV